MKQLFVVVLLVSGLAFAQEPTKLDFVGDAIKLAQAIEQNDVDVINEIKSRYNVDSNNPYLKDLITFEAFSAEFDNEGSNESVIRSPSSTSGISPDAIIRGLAIFLAERFEEEIAIEFLINIRKKIKEDETGVLKSFFSSTYKILNTLEAQQFRGYLPALRQAIQNDLKSIPENALDWVSKECMSGESLAGDLICGYVEIDNLVKLINSGASPDQVVLRAANMIVVERHFPNLKAPLLVMSAFYFAVQNSSSRFQDILVQKQALRTFVGLVYAFNNDLFVGIEFEDIVTLSKLDEFGRWLNLLASLYESQDLLASSLKSDVLGVSVDEYEIYIRSFIKTLCLFENYEGFDTSQVDEWKKILENSLNLYLEVKKGNYANSIVWAVEIVFPLDCGDINESNEPNGENEKRCEARANFLKFASFMANLEAAETSEQVAQAFRDSALPAGSWRIKRNAKFNLSLDAYVGLFYGEQDIEPSNDDEETEVTRFGLTAPVGLNASWSLGSGEKSSSLSLLVAAIDPGALVLYELDSDDDNSEELPKLDWDNVVSPGLHIMYGFPNSPITLGLGAQYGPRLREINVQDVDGMSQVELVNDGEWRYGVTVTIDLPLFNFRTKPR